MNKIKAVIFDKDGTLFDFQATWGEWAGSVLDEMCAGDDALKTRVAKDLGYDLKARCILPSSIVIAATPLEIAQRMVKHFPDYTSESLSKRLSEMAATSPQVMVTDLVRFCETLRGMGLKIAVMTNDSVIPAKAHLVAAGVFDAFDHVIGSDSGHGAKPDAAPLLALANMMGVAPQGCAMVGDSTHDLHAGRAAGMKTVAVLTGLAEQADLAPFADIVLNSIVDVPDWVAKQCRV